MNIKRYEPALLRHPIMREDPDGQWYHRADLIAAGVLVPVPVGGKCKLSKLEDLDIRDHTNTCTIEGADWRVYAAERREDNSGHRYLMPVSDEWPPIAFGPDTIVQPVRLVRLEDAE